MNLSKKKKKLIKRKTNMTSNWKRKEIYKQCKLKPIFVFLKTNQIIQIYDHAFHTEKAEEESIEIQTEIDLFFILPSLS